MILLGMLRMRPLIQGIRIGPKFLNFALTRGPSASFVYASRIISCWTHSKEFSTTSQSCCKSESTKANHNDKDKKKNDSNDPDEERKIRSLLLKSALLWTFGVLGAGYIYQESLKTSMREAKVRQDAALTPQAPSQQQNYNQQHNNHQFESNARISMSMTDLCHRLLAKGEVESIVIYPGGGAGDNQQSVIEVFLHPGAVVDNQRWPYRSFQMNVPDLETFETRLREFEHSIGISSDNSVPILYNRSASKTRELILLGLIGLVVFWIYRSRGKFAIKSGPQGFISQFTKAKYTLVDPLTRKAEDAVTFKDVAGLKEAKIEIMEFVKYLKNPGRLHKLGAKLPKGVLLLGPPGCGKTLLAKAVATEANVPFYALAGTDFVEMIGGVGASRVRDLFAQVRKASPCIVYIDEIDALGRKRSDGISGDQNREGEQTLNQLLVEMDGMSPRQGVILLASTNRPDVLDKALLRPGRFDRHIYLDYPNLEERREIFIQHAKKIKLQEPAENYALRISQLTPRMTGADLANICNEAALNAARKDQKTVSGIDLEYAIERVVGGTEKRSSAMTTSEKRMIAFHECGHALVGWLLEHTDVLLKVSIVPRTTNVLGFALTLPSEQKLLSRDEIFDRMCMAMGGRVAELIKFNHFSTGAANDLKVVTNMAMAQIKQYGLDPVIGHLSFPPQEPYMGLPTSAPYSKRLATTIDQRAQKLATDAFRRTDELLRDNLDKLNILAEALLEKEVLNYNDVEQLIGPPFGGKKKRAVEFIDTSVANAATTKEELLEDEPNNRV